MDAFKVEYFHNSEWHIAEYAGSIIQLLIVVNKWRNKGYPVRCINKLGEDIA